MRRRDLDKLRRLDPRLAAQLEGVMAKRGADAPSGGPEGPCDAPAPDEPRLSRGQVGDQPVPPEAPSRRVEAGPLACEEPEGPQTGLLSGEPCGGAQEPSEAPSQPSGGFADASQQVGLPEVPQVLVSTEASPEAKLEEIWTGYEDDLVPEEELERRKAERVAEREARMARYRENSRQLGFLPGAAWRRRGTGKHVPCEQLELQLDGIERRVGRASTWDSGLSAVQTMDHVEAQCFTVRDLGDRYDTMPSALRGLFPTLTRTQRSLLRAVVTAYMGGAMGIYEFQPILASDLDMSERAMRYALNGGAGRPPGLVELGLVRKRQTWKRGAGERPSDHHYLLLQAGPALSELLLPLSCEQRARRGEKPPRRCGYTRTSARAKAAAGRQAGRRARYERAERAVRLSRKEAGAEPQRQPRKGGQIQRSKPPKDCPAQNAVNPVPPPSGGGGLRDRRGRPPSPPTTDASLRDRSLAAATPPLLPSKASDSPPPSLASRRDRAQALDEAARAVPSFDPQTLLRGRPYAPSDRAAESEPNPRRGETKELDTHDLEVWRRRQQRGFRPPEAIGRKLLDEQLRKLQEAMWGE